MTRKDTIGTRGTEFEKENTVLLLLNPLAFEFVMSCFEHDARSQRQVESIRAGAGLKKLSERTLRRVLAKAVPGPLTELARQELQSLTPPPAVPRTVVTPVTPTPVIPTTPPSMGTRSLGSFRQRHDPMKDREKEQGEFLTTVKGNNEALWLIVGDHLLLATSRKAMGPTRAEGFANIGCAINEQKPETMSLMVRDARGFVMTRSNTREHREPNEPEIWVRTLLLVENTLIRFWHNRPENGRLISDNVYYVVLRNKAGTFEPVEISPEHYADLEGKLPAAG